MYRDAKKIVAERGYSSLSELVRYALRNVIYHEPKLTENGFTPEFEEEILRRANDPNEKYIEWDGKTDFTEFVLKNAPK